MEEPEGSNQKGIKKEVLYYLLVLQSVCTCFLLVVVSRYCSLNVAPAIH